ncbi:MAG: hypothetical protein IPM20_06350 [Gammaproteobacteria bacterium]|nr:hypothetical protein [Gammaproteobacteria bacterium]
MKSSYIIASFFFLFTLSASADDVPQTDADKQTNIINSAKGNVELSKAVVETAPGNVTAMSLLGISADDTTVIQNPRNLTLALKALNSDDAFGLSISPARTSLMPLSISTYDTNFLARLWAATSFSYAQGTSDSNDVSFERRAVAIETSYYLEPDKDDPSTAYWKALEKADGNNLDDLCVLLIPLKPDQTDKEWEKYQEEVNKRASSCMAKSTKNMRWNVSRLWFSWATGEYQPESGGDNHSLGRTEVIGLSWGFGDATDNTAIGITGAYKHVSDAPVLDTLSEDSPDRENSNLTTLRIAIGSPAIRALIEGSNTSDDTPTALNRTFKRAFGLDIKASESLWVNLRAGKQRKIDNTGDETGSSVSVSYSPSALLDL